MTAPNTHVPAGTNDQGQIITTPQTGAPIAPNAGVQAASDAARALIASQGSALPAQPDPQNPGATTDTPKREVATAQPRASDGTFGRPLPGDPAATPAPTDGLTPQTEQTPAPEGEAPPADSEAPAATVVPIEVNGEALDLDVGDPAIAEVIRSQIETAREAETIRADAEREIGEVLAIREHIQIDPVGFALRELRESPAGQEHLLLSLITQPELFNRVKDRVAKLVSDPNEFRTVAAEQRAARSEFAEQARHEVQEQAAVRQNLKDVQATCAAMARMLPNESLHPVAYNDMLRDLMAYADKQNVTTIPPEHIPVILANRLTALGINPVEAAQRAASSRKNGRGNTVAPPRATASATPRPAGAPLPPAPKPAPPNGQRFVESQQRRNAVAIPAAGAGSPGVGSDLVPPSNPDGSPMNTAQTLAWHRQQVAKGRQGLVPATR